MFAVQPARSQPAIHWTHAYEQVLLRSTAGRYSGRREAQAVLLPTIRTVGRSSAVLPARALAPSSEKPSAIRASGRWSAPAWEP